MINVGPSITQIILIIYLDYGPNPDNGSGLRNADPDNFVHDRLKMYHDLPHFYTDNFSRDNPTNDA